MRWKGSLMIDKIFRPKILNRPRIDKMLSQMLEVSVFFISASMGYGKSTAVKNFLRKKNEIQTIWFDNPDEDIDSTWRWIKFCNSIKVANPNLGQKLSAYGVPKNNTDLYTIIETIQNAIRQKTVMIIDDWYDAENIYVNYLIKAIALEEIPNLHIVIISRNKPSNQYIELELKQKCLVMWQDDISYTFEETVDFFKLNGIRLNDEEKEKVYEYTAGWTSATYLSLIQYYNEKTFDNIPQATELIKLAVYDKLDESTKQILLKLAPIDKFTLEQAIYVTENQCSRDVIRALSSNNCFIRYDTESKIYTLHSILRSALIEEALLNSDIIKINNLCGEWYYEKHHDMEAIEYYYKANNFDRVMDIMERNTLVSLTNVWDRIMKPVIEMLSMEQKVNRPVAYLIYIVFYIVYLNIEKGKELLYEFWIIYEMNEDLPYRQQVLGEIAYVETLGIYGDSSKMVQYLKKAYDLLGGRVSRVGENSMPLTFGSPHLLSLFYKSEGSLINDEANLRQFTKYLAKISGGCGEGGDYLVSAEYFFETGDCDKAELFAYKALHKAKLKNQTYIEICALFLLMRISVIKNDASDVKEKYDILTDQYRNFEVPRFFNGTEIALGYIDGITGNLPNMSKWLEDGECPNLQIVFPSRRMKYIVSAFTMLHEKSYIELEVQAEIMLEVYLTKKLIFGILYAYMIDSIAKYKLYGVESAKESLQKAINLAKRDNIVMVFVELSPHIIHVLRELAKEDEFAKVLLPKCERFNDIYQKNYAKSEEIELTPRELEVMKLVDEGYKQTEISNKLHIALITVKKHMASVYYKLDVNNKTVAINLLKQKGIL
ncbi:ATP-dependent transcriptional regulator, MalT-like, LuxR family [Clostridium saccharoperbutylacetonicum N1-4(HMT)]|uniref:ATP-dependent transcriptional regulator, MalT-like, LuxR family n=2 Tax=Clostridium saccharoperbutylacetonicum TaxID=36745 RepID=M1MV61_9CLOT|nr:ATP-dependent transcriptional regulator, MalT-like, LuxR family [Clostridium saccharoperbutylacetonicum N1-4(HMT)]